MDRLRDWRTWEADAETVIELCGEEDEGDEGAKSMLDEAMEVRPVRAVVTSPVFSGWARLLSLYLSLLLSRIMLLVNF